MDLPDFLTRTAFDEIRLTGHRIGLYHVILHYREGATAEMIVEEYPTLRLAHVQQVIAFYHEHQAEVDEYVDRCQAEIERQRATGRHLDLDKLRARMAEIRKAEQSGA